MMRRRLTAVLLATFMVLTAFAPAAASAQTTATPADLAIDVTQDPETGNATVTVTNGSGVLPGEQVNVTSAEPYAGNGTYETDANGTVGLPNPDETIEVDVEATYEGTTLVETVTLVPRSDSLDVALEQSDTDGSVTVDVTQYGTGVEGATVNVSSDASYAGNGTHETDADGTVTLAKPEETLNVTANVTSGDLEATATVEVTDVDTGFGVTVEQTSDGSAVVTVIDDGDVVENATVNVTSDVAYEGNGTYNTSESGTVDLPAPEQNVTVDVMATNGTDEANVTAELTVVENGGYANFGQWVTAYVDQLRDEGYFGKEFGQAVSSFATQNNPGADNRPDHAGPKDDDDDESAAAANETDDEQGPPEHAQNDKGDGGAESNTDDEQGPPEHAQNDEDDDAETDGEEATGESSGDADCSVGSADSADSDDECDDETEDDEEAADDDDDEDDDAPGKSGSRGNGGGNSRGK